ncbi:DUF418 domain-containing protein [Sinorhizobium meliloti]|uniref:DUF418 domain-containing protein n=1 Tax=Rhizobium meliloti TaxID=382 RepID=UPI0001E4CDDE|nr:DUF418 domain-containing protein [Sinorhizobium meliloti]AEG58233.1 protein of unknown function DUF418 [Sinorhizobium meliloti AK83]MDE4589232.1 DUF418 domain-containing protein [Sinorhizobium meliloti]SEJ88201.1 Uncharacterized membrane protein YeiB [Sinorhizobium meliloti]
MAKNASIEGTSDGSAVDRLVDIDFARGLAVFGMYVAHLGGGPIPDDVGLVGNLMGLADGRSSALFAVLAGFSIILITGRKAPKSGEAGRQAVARVAIRALVLLAIGSILTCLGTRVAVILGPYGICFLLVLPLYRLSAQQLGLLAAGTALVLPQMRFLLFQLFPEVYLDPVVHGDYPAMTWVPFVIAGMAIARLSLDTQAMHWRLGLAGVALAALGYGGSWLALRLLPSVSAALKKVLVAAPHSETTFSILGNTGCAMIVLAACWLAMDALPHLRKLVWPIIAVGSMSLTAYVLHIVGIAYFNRMLGEDGSLSMLFGFVVVIGTFAVLWLRVFQRGPMEVLMGRITDLARHIH